VSAGPDLAQALAGYRGWRLDDDLVLRGHTLPEPWAPGVNEARCRFHQFGGGRRRRHLAPHPRCMCGLYALCDRADSRLLGTDAIGSVAAWGDVQVHRTGFRAQFACVTALCALPELAGPKARARLEGAAKRYGVRLVTSLDDLEAEALRFGAPVDFELIEPAVEPAPAARRAPGARPGLGREIEQHTWARETAAGTIEIGLGRGLPARLAPADELVAPRPGQTVEKGAELGAAVARGGALVLTAPVSGTVTEVNEALAAAPAQAGDEDAAWLVRVRPSAWPAEAQDLVWGRGGTLVYGAFLAQEAEGVDVLADLRPELRRARPPVRTYADVLANLLAMRRAAPFADAHAFEAHAVEPVRRRLAADDALARHLARVGAVVELELSEPEALVVLDLRGERAAIRTGGAPAAETEARVRVTLPAPLAADCLAGRDDLLSTVRRKEATLDGERATLTLAASALSELLAPSRAWGHRRPRGRD
jgi:glycine cleavage system H lipoate-binding protein